MKCSITKPKLSTFRSATESSLRGWLEKSIQVTLGGTHTKFQLNWIITPDWRLFESCKVNVPKKIDERVFRLLMKHYGESAPKIETVHK